MYRKDSISIHALLAESDPICGSTIRIEDISIHALLAESDGRFFRRSGGTHISIHALLAESDVGAISQLQCILGYFYPRSPCGERLKNPPSSYTDPIFLSTLSLRRATEQNTTQQTKTKAFLSTLSLRRATCSKPAEQTKTLISIHALLAESDCGCSGRCRYWAYFYPRSPCGERPKRFLPMCTIRHFYPRSPCGERRCGCFARCRF